MPKKVRVRKKVSPERSRIRLAQRRKKQRTILLIVSVILALCLVFGFFYALHLPKLNIQKVSVEGSYSTSATEVYSAVNSQLDKDGFYPVPLRSILFYPKSEIKKNLLQEFPEIKDVEIHRASLLSTELIVRVDERVIYGIWCNGDTSACFNMDAEGVIFSPADGFSEWTIFYGGIEEDGNPIFSVFYDGKMGTLRELLVLMAQNGFDSKTVVVEKDSSIFISLLEGWSVKVSLEEGPEWVIATLQSALKSEALQNKRENLDYIDVRYGNRVYFKFKE